MRPVFLIVLLLICYIPGRAVANLDSLKGVFYAKSSDESEKILACREIIQFYFYQQLDSAEIYSTHLVDLSMLSGDSLSLINALQNYGRVNCIAGKPDKAIFHLEKALEISVAYHSDSLILNSYNLIGFAWELLAEYEEALKYYFLALEKSEKLENTFLRLMVLNNLGALYQISGRPKLAETYFLQILEISLPHNDSNTVATAYQNLGIALADQRKYEQAIEYYEAALRFEGPVPDKFSEAQAFAGLGSAHLELGNLDAAERYAEDANMTFEEVNFPFGRSSCLNVLGRVYLETGRKKQALNALRKAWKLNAEIEDLAGKKETSNNLHLYFSKANQADSALHYLTLHHAIAEEISGAEVQEGLEKERVKKELEQQRESDSLRFAEKLNSLQAESNERAAYPGQFLFGIIGGISLIVLSLGLFFWYKSRKQVNEQEEDEKAIEFEAPLVEKVEIPSKGLDRRAVEQSIDFRLNDTDWAILNALYQTPTLTYKQLAQEVSLSFEGVRSSLKKMYRLFLLNGSGRGQKEQLMKRVIELSASDNSGKD